jgi:hypothetical protein
MRKTTPRVRELDTRLGKAYNNDENDEFVELQSGSGGLGLRLL